MANAITSNKPQSTVPSSSPTATWLLVHIIDCEMIDRDGFPRQQQHLAFLPSSMETIA